MVFSLLGAMVFTGAVVFVILFIFIYPITRPYALSYVAVAIGIVRFEWRHTTVLLCCAARTWSSDIFSFHADMHHLDQDDLPESSSRSQFQCLL